MYFNWYYQK